MGVRRWGEQGEGPQTERRSLKAASLLLHNSQLADLWAPSPQLPSPPAALLTLEGLQFGRQILISAVFGIIEEVLLGSDRLGVNLVNLA